MRHDPSLVFATSAMKIVDLENASEPCHAGECYKHKHRHEELPNSTVSLLTIIGFPRIKWEFAGEEVG